MIRLALGGLLLALVAIDSASTEPALKDLSKTKSGAGRGGFYSSRFGSVYNARDFEDQPATVQPEKSIQLPSGIAGPHQQNLDEELKIEIPNVEEGTAAPLLSDDLRSGIKGGVKGRRVTPFTYPPPIKVEVNNYGSPSSGPVLTTRVPDDLQFGVKGGVKGLKGRLSTPEPEADVARYTTIGIFVPSTVQPPQADDLTLSEDLKRGTPVPDEDVVRIPDRPEVAQPESPRGDVVDTTAAPVSEELRRKTKNIKGGRKGYQHDPNNIRALFNEPTETYLTTAGNPQILNLPTERRIEATYAPATEDYRQQTENPVQQTEIPLQQTETPLQQTEIPLQQTEIPLQQTEIPLQQTEIPVQQTEEPFRETEPTTRRTIVTTYQPTYIPTTEYEPVQDTQSPLLHQETQQPELPVQTTYNPVTTEIFNEQQTEIPQVTQLPEEPIYVTQVPTTQAPDEFYKYPLGPEGRHLIKGGGSGKGKGARKGARKVGPLAGPRVINAGSVGVESRTVNPSIPLLPSLRGRQ